MSWIDQTRSAGGAVEASEDPQGHFDPASDPHPPSSKVLGELDPIEGSGWHRKRLHRSHTFSNPS